MVYKLENLGLLTAAGFAVLVSAAALCFTILASVTLAPVALAETPAFTLPYRAENRWVHVDDNKPLNNLTDYAKENKVYTFRVVLPENDKTNLYIERLLVLSRIMKARLNRDSIIFRQDLGETPENTIKLTPIED